MATHEAGLESLGARRRKIWRAPAVLAALDAFAVRAGRRAPPTGG